MDSIKGTLSSWGGSAKHKWQSLTGNEQSKEEGGLLGGLVSTR